MKITTVIELSNGQSFSETTEADDPDTGVDINSHWIDRSNAVDENMRKSMKEHQDNIIHRIIEDYENVQLNLFEFDQQQQENLL